MTAPAGFGINGPSGALGLNVSAAGIAASLAAPLAPPAFTSGDLVIYRVGDGATAISSGATAVFLDEYTTTGVLVQSIALPTTVNGSNKRLTASGTATSEGGLTLSADGQYLTAAGYDAAPGTASITSSTASAVNRVIARIDANGNVDTTTALTDAISGGNPRGATSTNGADLWISGTSSGGGVRYAALGATTSTALNTSPVTNLRQVNVFGGQLYVSSQSGALRLGTVGTGTPTTAGQTITNLPGYTTNSTSPYGFFFADLNPGVPGVDTLYVADDNASGGTGGIQKYSLVSGSWTANGSIASTGGLRGLTGSVSGSTVTLYITGSSGANGTLFKLTDTSGYNATITGPLTSLVTAGANKAFRGIAFAPSGATPTTFNLTVSTAGTGAGNVTSSPAGISCPSTCSASFNSGALVTLTPTAGANSTFAGWSGDCTGAGPCTVTMSAARSVTATFNSTLRTLSVSRGGTGAGTVTSSPAGINCGATCTATYADSTNVTLTANASANSVFTNWTGCDSTLGNTCTVAMGANRSVTANFASTQRVLSVNRTGTGTGAVTSSPAGINCGATCTATYADGTPVTMTATADPNSTFAGWSGDCTGAGPCSVTMDADKSVTATFNLKPLPTTVKISQVYGGGGNSGSTYTNDFIELYNSGSTPVTIDGWSLQATSAAGTSWTANGVPTPLSGTIQPGHYYLVQESQGAAGTTSLPTPDASGALTLSGANAKVALVAFSTAPLSGSCPLGGQVVDFVGYGTANCAEGGAAAPGLSNTTAAVRRGNGCTDTDNNSTDFVAVGPIPRNSASPVNQCGGDPSQPSGLGVASPGSLDPSSNTLLTVKVTPATAPPSTDISVNGDLTAIGGAAAQQFYDDGTHGDVTAGDNTFSFEATVAANIPTGVKNIVTTITDAQARIATAPITLTVQSPSCGVERWSVKVGTDNDVNLVNLNNPVHTTIGELSALTPPPDPPGPPDNSRIQPTEATVYVLDAVMIRFKKETDVDYHIVLQDPNTGSTMIAEIPLPACVIGPNPNGPGRILMPSPLQQGIADSRAKFDARFAATEFFQNVSVPVRVKGVGFFDFIHGQSGVAPNGIELHPVLDISFTANTTTTLMSSANPSQYGQQVSITATVSNGGAAAMPTGSVSFFDGNNPLGTVGLDQNGQATLTTGALSVGPHSITASYEGDDASAPSTSAPLSQAVNKADQTITFPAIASFTWVGGSATLNATASSGLAVTYSILSGPCSVSGNTLTATGAGSCTVAADQAGDGNYNAAPQTTSTATVNKADQSITFGPLADKTYGDAPFNVSATGGDSGNPVTFSASGNCASGGTNGSTITINGAGACTVTASQAGNLNYNAAPDAPRPFNINKAAAVVSVNGYTGVYDGQAHAANGSATGVGGEDLSSLLNLGGSFKNVPGGTTGWSFAGNANYSPDSGTVNIVITKATPAFSSLSSPSIGCGAATVNLSGRISLGPLAPTGVVAVILNGITQNTPIQPDGSFSSAFSTGALTPAGSPYAVTFSYGGDGNFNPAGGVSTLSVSDTVPPTITLNGQVISLWPVNKQVYTINVADLVASASDGCDAGVNLSSVVISQVSSDEGVASSGDVVIGADCRSVQLRANRNGSGDGRVYTITFLVRDAYGNTATADAKVVVPHDQGSGNNAVDSGPAYTVNGSCP